MNIWESVAESDLMPCSDVLPFPHRRLAWAELQACSNFTFLTGGSHPEEYMDRAALLGLSAVAIADVNSVAGIVRAHTRAREIARQVAERQEFDRTIGLIGPPAPPGFRRSASAHIYNIPRLLPAAKIVLREGLSATLLPKTRVGWGQLCRFISRGRLRADKGGCDLEFDDLLEFGSDQLILLHAPPALEVQPGAPSWVSHLRRLTRRFAADVMLLLYPCYDGQDEVNFARIAALAQRYSLPLVASAAPIMHHGARRRLTDTLTAIRLGVRVDALGRSAQVNAEQRLRSPEEAAILFQAYPEALHKTAEVLEQLTFSLDALRYEYPSELNAGENPSDRLRRLAYEGLAWRYPSGAT
ncbi:error-prone DNA polymerase, partial [Planktomarina temperata]|nr:error-prone DNA polymerase [Planktomarina temperata]